MPFIKAILNQQKSIPKAKVSRISNAVPARLKYSIYSVSSNLILYYVTVCIHRE